MAISGATAALVRAGAQEMGCSFEELAEYSNFSADPTFAVAVNGSELMQGDATWSNIPGTMVRVWWGDGTVEDLANDGSATHLYSDTATFTVGITGLGVGLSDTVAITGV